MDTSNKGRTCSQITENTSRSESAANPTVENLRPSVRERSRRIPGAKKHVCLITLLIFGVILLFCGFVIEPELVPGTEEISRRIDDFQNLLIKVVLACFLIFACVRLVCNEILHLIAELGEHRRR